MYFWYYASEQNTTKTVKSLALRNFKLTYNQTYRSICSPEVGYDENEIYV